MSVIHRSVESSDVLLIEICSECLEKIERAVTVFLHSLLKINLIGFARKCITCQKIMEGVAVVD